MEVVSGDVVTMCRFNILERMVIPAHSHPQEQLAYVINGKMKMRVGNLERTLGPGDIQIVPGNVEHSAEVLEVPFQEIDVFSPVRQDFLESCPDDSFPSPHDIELSAFCKT